MEIGLDAIASLAGERSFPASLLGTMGRHSVIFREADRPSTSLYFPSFCTTMWPGCQKDSSLFFQGHIYISNALLYARDLRRKQPNTYYSHPHRILDISEKVNPICFTAIDHNTQSSSYHALHAAWKVINSR